MRPCRDSYAWPDRAGHCWLITTPGTWSASVERIEFVDSRLTPVWGAFVSRGVLLASTRLEAAGPR